MTRATTKEPRNRFCSDEFRKRLWLETIRDLHALQAKGESPLGIARSALDFILSKSLLTFVIWVLGKSPQVAAVRFLFDWSRELRFRRWSRQCRKLGDEDFIRRQYRKAFGRELDLENPQRFSDKLQYIKLYGISELHRTVADKLNARDYVASTIGADTLVPLYRVLDDAAELREETIVLNRFVAKATHDSGSAQICLDRNYFNWPRARRLLRFAVQRDFSYVYGERQYRDLKAKILVEQFVPHAGLPHVHRIFCCQGDPKIIQYHSSYYPDDRINFYDTEWNPVHLFVRDPPADLVIDKPANLGKMLNIAAKLAAPFNFARIDFLDCGLKLYFSEITLMPFAGFRRRFLSEFWEKELGAELRLNVG